MIIFLIRHGDYKNDKLTNKGKKQIKMLLKQNFIIPPTAIFSSPSKRCVQSATIISKKLKMPIFVNTNLKERFNLNHEPTTPNEVDWYNNYFNLEYESNIETLSNYLKQNYEFLNFLQKNFKKDDVIYVVAHSANAYAFNSYINKLNFSHIGISNGSAIRFEI